MMYEMMMGYTNLFITQALLNHSVEFSKIFLLGYAIRRCTIHGASFEAGPIPACQTQFQYMYTYKPCAVARSK